VVADSDKYKRAATGARAGTRAGRHAAAARCGHAAWRAAIARGNSWRGGTGRGRGAPAPQRRAASNRATLEATRTRVLALVREKYSDASAARFGPTLAAGFWGRASKHSPHRERRERPRKASGWPRSCPTRNSAACAPRWGFRSFRRAHRSPNGAARASTAPITIGP
jgi:hypothetical protein